MPRRQTYCGRREHGCDRHLLDSTMSWEQTTVANSRQLGGALQRIRNVALVGLGVILIAGAAFASPAARAGRAFERRTGPAGRTNQLRATQGVPALQIDPEAQALAEQWSQYMASGTVRAPTDQYAGISTPVYWVGDDIARSLSLNGVWEPVHQQPGALRQLGGPAVRLRRHGSHGGRMAPIGPDQVHGHDGLAPPTGEPPVASDDPVHGYTDGLGGRRPPPPTSRCWARR